MPNINVLLDSNDRCNMIVENILSICICDKHCDLQQVCVNNVECEVMMNQLIIFNRD